VERRYITAKLAVKGLIFLYYIHFFQLQRSDRWNPICFPSSSEGVESSGVSPFIMEVIEREIRPFKVQYRPYYRLIISLLCFTKTSAPPFQANDRGRQEGGKTLQRLKARRLENSRKLPPLSAQSWKRWRRVAAERAAEAGLLSAMTMGRDDGDDGVNQKGSHNVGHGDSLHQKKLKIHSRTK
jgi:hypothetical protein